MSGRRCRAEPPRGGSRTGWRRGPAAPAGTGRASRARGFGCAPPPGPTLPADHHRPPPVLRTEFSARRSGREAGRAGRPSDPTPRWRRAAFAPRGPSRRLRRCVAARRDGAAGRGPTRSARGPGRRPPPRSGPPDGRAVRPGSRGRSPPRWSRGRGTPRSTGRPPGRALPSWGCRRPTLSTRRAPPRPAWPPLGRAGRRGS